MRNLLLIVSLVSVGFLPACAQDCASCTAPKATAQVAPPFVRPSGTLDQAAIEAAAGLKGTFSESENVFKVTQPKKGITVDGRTMEPFMGFTSWAAFTPGKRAPAMMAGDLVLFEDEVDPAMDALFAHGLKVTAIHNHFFHTKPAAYFMHIGGEGDAAKMAEGVKAALDAVKARRDQAGPAGDVAGFDGPAIPAQNAVTAAPLDAIFGLKGQAKDGMYKAVWGRTVAMSCGCVAGKEMGVNTWAALCGDDEHACVAGDFITFGGELQPVLAALRAHGIHVVAIHSHMEGENPKAVFLHYWGKGAAADLAKGVKAALEAQAAVK